MFYFEDCGEYTLKGANWEAAEFYPRFEEKQLKDYGDKELFQDEYGRSVLVLKKSHTGYMPEYIGSPVKDINSWKEKCAWRMNPTTKERYDDPKLIHTCMEAWFQLADAVTAYHQKFVTIDELFLGEDITYNQGPLISPDMIRQFLFPYYERLINNVKARQLDKDRKLFIHLDSDGRLQTVIPLYQELGFNVFSPFEVASGCDVVKIGKEFPDIVMSGGIDKRMFSASRQELKAYLDNLLPVMKARGAYYPTCNHGVPAEADFDNYCY